MPYDSLMKATQLVLATTQDETDAEEEAVPLKIVPHPPPITLSTDMGLLLPEFQVENKRSEHLAPQETARDFCSRETFRVDRARR